MTPLLITSRNFWEGHVQNMLISLFCEVLPQRLSSSQITSLDNKNSDDEIQKVFFSLKNNKAPGMDLVWVSLRKLEVLLVKTPLLVFGPFFSSCLLLKQVNATTIALISKVANPFRVKDFRPISCCKPFTNALPRL